MPVDPSVDSKPVEKKGKKKNRKSQLRVVFDTNALYVASTALGSASDLVRQEIASLIADSKYPDLDILWYLPEVVRHERQYQMQTEALKLRFPINRIERLLGHNLALTDQVLLDHVKAKIEEKKTELGLQELTLDHAAVDWPALIRAAEYRLPPFESGEKEKGFRDALVAESFLQLLTDSPKTPAVCRVVLVTGDGLLTEAVKGRIENSPNASILPGIEELKGLINTLVSNVGEDFIAHLKPKAGRLFFTTADDKDTLLYREKVIEKLEEKFGPELQQRPEGTTFRTNKTWTISRPNFSRKDGRRILWTSRIEIEVEAGVTTKDEESTAFVQTSGAILWPTASRGLQSPNTVVANAPVQPFGDWYQSLVSPSGSYATGVPIKYLAGGPQKRIVTHKGSDIFEVLWSAELTMNKDLKKAAVEAVQHVQFTCAPVSQG